MIVSSKEEFFDDNKGTAGMMWNKMIDKLDKEKRKVTINCIVFYNL